MPRARTLLLAALPALALSACAYFNSLYNARRFYSDAQRAAARGEEGAAAAAYNATIQKAAASYRRDSTGRWSNEALELIGRSYFAIGDYARSRAAFERMLERGARGERAAAARAYLGAAFFRSGQPREALPPLDSAAAGLAAGTELGAFARLWRARTRFALADSAGAWSDLGAAGGARGAIGVDATLERIARAVAAHDSARAASAFAAALQRGDMAAKADSMRTLARAAAHAWGSPPVRAFLGGASRAAWPTDKRLDLQLFRASLAAEGGDTTAALAEADAVARGPDRVMGARARVAVSRWRLASARDLAAADAVRSELLAAVADAQAQQILRALKMLDVLVDRAPQGEPIALFAAAELARDQLGAPLLARRLFLAYADLVPGAQWAPKALMAAATLAPPAARDSLQTRLARYAASIYVRPRGTPAADSAFADAETRLARALSGVNAYAALEASRRDAGVTRVMAVLDSVKTAARTDSLRIACGAFADSAGISGTRGDSLRAACVRGDSLKVALFLKPDTMNRADSAGVRRLPGAGRGAVARDTIH